MYRPSSPASPISSFRSAFRKVAFGISLAAAALTCCVSARADSVTVSYSIAPLSGSGYQYSYTLSGNLSANDDLAIFFPLGSVSSLSNPSSSSADFYTYVLQPDSALPADGEFDITPLVANPDLSSTFTVDVLGTGVNLPSSQSFTLYDSDFNVLQTGTTQAGGVAPAVTPEPASLWLLATGLSATLATRRRFARSL